MYVCMRDGACVWPMCVCVWMLLKKKQTHPLDPTKRSEEKGAHTHKGRSTDFAMIYHLSPPGARRFSPALPLQGKPSIAAFVSALLCSRAMEVNAGRQLARANDCPLPPASSSSSLIQRRQCGAGMYADRVLGLEWDAWRALRQRQCPRRNWHGIGLVHVMGKPDFPLTDTRRMNPTGRVSNPIPVQDGCRNGLSSLASIRIQPSSPVSPLV